MKAHNPNFNSNIPPFSKRIVNIRLWSLKIIIRVLKSIKKVLVYSVQTIVCLFFSDVFLPGPTFQVRPIQLKFLKMKAYNPNLKNPSNLTQIFEIEST